MAKRNPPFVWVIIGGSALVTVALAAGLVWFVASNATIRRELTAAERAAVVTKEALAEWHGALDVKNGKETIDVQQFRGLGGSFEIDYEYESDTVYIAHSLVRELTESQARDSYRAYAVGLSVGLHLADAPEHVSWDDRLQFGDESSVSLLGTEAEPGGHIARVRDGKLAFLLLIGGAYTDDPEELEALVLPKLEAMHRIPATVEEESREEALDSLVEEALEPLNDPELVEELVAESKKRRLVRVMSDVALGYAERVVEIFEMRYRVIEACLSDGETFDGEFEVVLAYNGRVEDVSVRLGADSQYGTAACVMGRIRRWRFARPPEPGLVMKLFVQLPVDH